MSERPDLDKSLDSKTFRSYYYLKEELTAFCRQNGLPVSGGKLELTERIACFLDTGRVTAPAARSRPGKRGKAPLQRRWPSSRILSAPKGTGPFQGEDRPRVFL